jgi:transcriptional regulator NrdR family protein
MWKIGDKTESVKCAKCQHPHTLVIDRRPCSDDSKSIALAFQCLKCYHIFHKRILLESSTDRGGRRTGNKHSFSRLPISPPIHATLAMRTLSPQTSGRYFPFLGQANGHRPCSF